MKKIFFSAFALALLGIGQVSAQDVYTVESLSRRGLDGDARFVGMGGAMSALGANLSAMHSNPASTGIYRHNDCSVSAGFETTPGARIVGPNNTRGVFNQCGMVFACQMDGSSALKYVNFGFNFKRNNSLKSYIGLDGVTMPSYNIGGENVPMSQTWQFADLCCDVYDDVGGDYLNMQNSTHCGYTTPMSDLAYQTYMIDPYDEQGNLINKDPNAKVAGYDTYSARSYNYHRAQWGAVDEYDINLSMNFNEQFYIGASFGVQSLNAYSALLYEEDLLVAGGKGYYGMANEESISGRGYNGKFGIIARPLAENPLRLGFSITTPTLLRLTSSKYLAMNHEEWGDDRDNRQVINKEFRPEDGLVHTYRIRTPWRLNASLATTVGNRVALDAEYEFTNFSSADVRYSNTNSHTGGSYRSDLALKGEINECLQNIHIVRVGAEARLSKEVALRVGYNYESSPYQQSAYRNNFVNDESYLYAVNTDYVNLGSTNRVSFGLGYSCNFCYFDAAYVFETRAAKVSAFHFSADDDNICSALNALPAVKTDLDRHQFQVTFGLRF